MDNLDLDVVILAHVALTLGAAISVSPAYNLPIALFGLTVAGKAERQFAGLHAISIVLDLMWLVSGWTEQASTLSIILVVTNMLLKPVSVIAALGNLRQRGEPTMSLPGFSGSLGGLGAGQTVWSAPSFGNNANSYQGFSDTQEEDAARPPAPRSANSTKAQPAPAPVPLQNAGGGYHTLGDE